MLYTAFLLCTKVLQLITSVAKDASNNLQSLHLLYASVFVQTEEVHNIISVGYAKNHWTKIRTTLFEIYFQNMIKPLTECANFTYNYLSRVKNPFIWKEIVCFTRN